MSPMPIDTQNEWKERARKRKRRSRLYRMSNVLFILFFLIFVVSAGAMVYQFTLDKRDAELYSELTHLVADSVEHPSDPTRNPGSSDEPSGPQEPVILAKYQTVYAMNHDLFGWLSIDDTTFNYPVMHTPEEEEYYLRRGYNHKSSRSGVPFLDGDCVTDCGNYLIYGHNMNNGTMFAQLLPYEKESFWKEHPVISFDTLFQESDYEVISAFYSRVFYQHETNVFRYYNYHDLTDPEVFQEYVDQVKAMSLYDTGVEAEYGDQLITLITCSYGQENERFVVVARKQS